MIRVLLAIPIQRSFVASRSSGAAVRGLNMKLVAFQKTRDLKLNERQVIRVTLDIGDFVVIDDNGTSWSIPERYQAVVTNGVETIGTISVVLSGRKYKVEELPDIF